MAPLIPIALQLAQFAPQIIKWVTGSDKAEEAAEKVVQIAQNVTGYDSGEQALAALKQDPMLVLNFQQQISAQEHELDLAFLSDVKDARARDFQIRSLGQRNWRPDIMFFLAVGVILWLVYLIWSSPDLNEYTKGIFTLLLGRFTGYLDAIYNFEFSSTRSSKAKDQTIELLSKK